MEFVGVSSSDGFLFEEVSSKGIFFFFLLLILLSSELSSCWSSKFAINESKIVRVSIRILCQNLIVKFEIFGRIIYVALV